MTTITKTPEEFISLLPEDRKIAVSKLREVLLKHLPKGFKETMNQDMIDYVVPHELYPAGYHCDPKLPLPFISIASQKNFIALYHNGIYADDVLLNWFAIEYKKHSKNKLNMGKSCIRFKKPEAIPFELIGELASKLTPEQWIRIYEDALK